MTGLALCIAASGPALPPETGRAAQPGPDALSALPEFRSVGGKLAVALVAASQRVAVAGTTIPGMTYNGIYGGPVLRVQPGDTIAIHLVNKLSEPTNLHFHGIQASPQGNSDNVHLSVAPGTSFDYAVTVPRSQPAGLFWYHAHIHGNSESQVMRGLSGALLVDGFAAGFPELGHISERLLVLKQATFEPGGDPTLDRQLHDRVLTLNGETDARFTMRPGETQLWHLGNFGPNLIFNLAIEGHTFRVVGLDGVARRRTDRSETLRILPAGRMEVLVDAGAPGRYDIFSQSVATGQGAARSTRRVLGQLIVAGPPAAPAQAPVSVPPWNDLRTAHIDDFRSVIFTESTADNRYYVNAKLFDPERVDFRIPLGNTEEWTIRNDSDDLHVFHIHQVDFQVTQINGEPQPFDGYVDVVRIPERGSVTIRLAFNQPQIVGRFMFHCHVLQHEDGGMMGQIEVYDPNTDGFWYRVKRLIQLFRAQFIRIPLCGRH